LTASCFLIPSSDPVFGWCIGLASALIILGLGYLINVLLLIAAGRKFNPDSSRIENDYNTYVKERSGYLVCKIMNILLCLYLLILNELGCDSIILLLGIILVLIQFLLDFLIQLILHSRRGKDKE
jgi:hypothetical protein